MRPFDVENIGYIKPKIKASKNPAVSALQDLLFYQLTGLSFFAKNAMLLEKNDKNTNSQISRLLYLCNKGINFSINAMISAINEAYRLKNRVENLYKLICKNLHKKPKRAPVSSSLIPADNLAQMVSQANVVNAQKTIRISNFNIFSMHEIIRKSLEASANYLEHIKKCETISNSFYFQIYDILDFLSSSSTNISECASYALKAGELHTQVLEKLISAYEKTYGLIERKKVSTSYKKGSAILVVGDDFEFLKKLLDATENTSINIYTYGTLNYAHSFSQINKYKNLAGIYLGEYGEFSADIESFSGVVVLTSGNIEELSTIYRGRIYSTEDISMLGVSHVETSQFKTLINSAYDAQGFEQDKENSSVEVGFGLKELEYYTEKLYRDLKNKSVASIEILLGYEKFYFDAKNAKQTFFIFVDCSSSLLKSLKSTMTLNMGQFVNIYTLIRLLFALAGRFKKDINEMPVNIAINLRSSDTIATLLMLLSLGIKNIKVTSELPNYLTQSLLKIFRKEYNLQLLSEIYSIKNQFYKYKN